MNKENSTPMPPRSAETIVADYLLSYSGDFGTLDDYRHEARQIIDWLKDEGWFISRSPA